jgi:ankyrin repeat protein
LIKAGANVNAKDGDGYTALIFASAQGNINIVKALIQAKADLTQTDQYNKTALDYAVDFEHDAIKSILQKAEATNSKYQNDPLIKAVDKLRQAVDNAKIEKPKSQEDSQHPEDKNIQSSI